MGCGGSAPREEAYHASRPSHGGVEHSGGGGGHRESHAGHRVTNANHPSHIHFTGDHGNRYFIRAHKILEACAPGFYIESVVFLGVSVESVVFLGVSVESVVFLGFM